jgi:hypothetical protein
MKVTTFPDNGWNSTIVQLYNSINSPFSTLTCQSNQPLFIKLFLTGLKIGEKTH